MTGEPRITRRALLQRAAWTSLGIVFSPAVAGCVGEATDIGRSSARTTEVQQSVDATTSEPRAVRRGPDGTHWPADTPAYTTPARVKISRLDELDRALATANSGDVIEVEPHTYALTSDTTIASGGDALWAQNVLVRPPIGQRQSVVIEDDGAGHSAFFNTNRVTYAGFLFNAFQIRTVGPERLHLARYVWGPETYAVYWGGTDCGWYEVVAPEYGVGSDRAQLKTEGVSDLLRHHIKGCYLAGQFREIGSDAHGDTIQFLQDSKYRVIDPVWEDSVLLTSSDKVLQGVSGYQKLIIRNCYLNSGMMSDSIVPDGYELKQHASTTTGVGTPGTAEAYDTDFNGSLYSKDVWGKLVRCRVAVENSVTIDELVDSQLGTGDIMPDPVPPTDAYLDSIWEAN